MCGELGHHTGNCIHSNSSFRIHNVQPFIDWASHQSGRGSYSGISLPTLHSYTIAWRCPDVYSRNGHSKVRHVRALLANHLYGKQGSWTTPCNSFTVLSSNRAHVRRIAIGLCDLISLLRRQDATWHQHCSLFSFWTQYRSQYIVSPIDLLTDWPFILIILKFYFLLNWRRK